MNAPLMRSRSHGGSEAVCLNFGSFRAARTIMTDLVVVSQWIAECRDSRTWLQAKRRSGPFAIRAVEQLTRCRDSEFVAATLALFRPAADSPHKFDADEGLLVNVAVRAVAAHAILASFFDKLVRFRVGGELATAVVARTAPNCGRDLLDELNVTEPRSATSLVCSNSSPWAEESRMLVVANEAHGRLDNAIATDLLTRLEEEYLVAVVSAHEPVFRAIVHDAAEVACLPLQSATTSCSFVREFAPPGNEE